jgi:DNA polymerase-1
MKVKPTSSDTALFDVLLTKKQKQLTQTTKVNKPTALKIAEARQSLVSAGGMPQNYHVVQDVQGLGILAREISKARYFAFDTETSGLQPYRDECYCVSFWVEGHGYLVNFAHPLLPIIDKEQFRTVIGPYFKDDSIYKKGFNLLFDAGFLHSNNLADIGYLHSDASVAVWLHDERIKSKSLDNLAEIFLGEGKGGGYASHFGKLAWVVLDPLVASIYAIKDAELHNRLVDFFEEALKEHPKVYKQFHKMRMPALNIYFESIRDGFLMDEDFMPVLSQELQGEIDTLVVEMNQLMEEEGQAPPENWSSPEQVAEALYDRLKLPPIKGRSTDKEVLEKLDDRHPIPGKFLEYRKLNKLKSSFVDGINEFIIDKYLHPSIKPIGTVTTRPSSSDPNLLNIPSRGRGVVTRQLFLAPDDHYMVSIDLAGQELRWIAALSGDKEFIRLAQVEGAVYEEAAALFFGGRAADYDKHGIKSDKRNKGKQGVLAFMYGASAGKISQIFKCSFGRAQDWISAFLKRFPGFAAWIKRQKEKVHDIGYVEMEYGYRQHLEIKPYMSQGEIKALERNATNSPGQANAAEQICLAMVQCKEHFTNVGSKAKIKLNIYDELLFYIPKSEVWHTTIIQEISYIMRNTHPNLPIEFATTVEIYERWGKKIDIPQENVA